jgi:tetratricopeptide (TPR) repeat protein
LKNALLIVTLAAMLSACALPHPETAAVPGTGVSAADSIENSMPPGKGMDQHHAAPMNAQHAEAAPPSVALTPEILFKLLSAETAYQRGDWQAAYSTMLGVAQKTRDPRIARRATEMAMNVKQATEALAAIRLWRELAPDSEEASQYFLGFIIVSDKLTEAQPIFAKRLKDAGKQERGILIFQIQRILARAKDKFAAFSMLEELLKPYRAAPEAALALAQAAFANGDTARASTEARAALSARPDSELAALTLAQVTPNQTEATEGLAQFLATHPASREVRIAYARLLLEQKQFEAARSEFETLLKDQPQDPGALYALGILGVQANDPKSAERYLSAYVEVLKAKPNEQRDPAQALLILAQIAEQHKDSDAELRWLEKIEPAETQNAAYFSALLKRAQITAKRGDLPGARKLLDDFDAENDAEQVQIIQAKAQILRDANLSQQAFALLGSDLKRFPDNTDLLYDYAMAAEKIGDLKNMERTLRRIITLDPGKQHAYNALGYSLAERNTRLREAHSLIEKALKIAPEDPFIIDSMGWVQFRQGKLKEAEELLRRAYGIRADPEIAMHLGEVLWNRGRKGEALQLWRDALAKDPQNEALKSTLTRLKVTP